MEQDIGHVSYWARLYSLKAACDAINARILGMQAFNQERLRHGDASGYGEAQFCEMADQLDRLSAEFAKI